MIKTTTIDHNIRATLRLTCDQYAIADAINHLHFRSKPTTIKSIAWELGMTETIVSVACIYLVGCNLVTQKDGKYQCTQNWISKFFNNMWFDNPLPRSLKDNPPADYVPGWWQIYKREGSSKSKSLAYFTECIKIVDRHKLLFATKKYLDSVSDPQYIMYAEKFLNPKDKRWEAYLPEEAPKIGFGEVPKKDMSAFV